MEWISVIERMPKDDEDVLCVFTGWDDMKFQRVLSFDEAHGEWVDWNGLKHNNVTHWMELPANPE